MDKELRFKKEKVLCQLMTESQNGNAVSYELLLEEVSLFLQNYLSKKLSNKWYLDDIIQEVLIGVHKSRDTYDQTKSFMSWLLAITHYKLTDHFRLNLKSNQDEINDSLEDLNPNALETLIENEQFQKLELALNSLDSRSKEVVTLIKIKGFKISEVSSLLGVSEANVKIISHRAYKQLEIKLKDFL